jgi:hypothetical protein
VYNKLSCNTVPLEPTRHGALTSRWFVLGPSPSWRSIPRTSRSAPACLLPGPEKNWANEVLSSASLVAFFSFFTSSAPPLCGWSEIASQVALTYAASIVVGLAAQQAVLISSVLPNAF